MRTVHFLILLLALALVADVDAGWKFWKKKKDETTTVDPLASTTASVLSVSSTTAEPAKAAVTPTPTQKRGPATTPASATRGIAALADPALAVGVGSVGEKIREDARTQPRRPSPGTDVGLDIGQPKPARPGVGGSTGGQGYRDWAADLTGAGEPGRQSPPLPAQGPALSPGGLPSSQGNRPTSVPGTPTGQQPVTVPDSKPASVPGTPTGQHTPASGPVVGKPGSPTPAPTPAARPSIPTGQQQPSPGIASPQTPRPAYPSLPQPGYAQPGHPQPSSPGGSSSPPASPGSKSYAAAAGSRTQPSSPNPTPKPGTPTQPSRAEQRNPFEFPQPGSGNPATRPGLSPGSTAAIGGAALAGGAIAATAGTGGKQYTSNPTFSKGNTVTDEDLEKLAEALFIKDVNNANKYITLNLQKKTSGSSPKDEAPQPLLEVKPEAFQLATIQKVLSIHDNYKLDTRESEYISPAQRQEESLLVDTFLSTSVMSAAMRFLADKGFVKKDYYEYKDTLRGMWFNLYSRGDGKIGSTGFEHVFLTELKLGTEVSGLHNWIYFNAEEIKKRLDYLGYIKKVDLGNKAAIVKAHIKFNGIDKPVTNIFIGTSPELEMALYTVCFFARPDDQCPVSLGGTKFNILTHKFRYRGRDLIGSAYPEI